MAEEGSLEALAEEYEAAQEAIRSANPEDEDYQQKRDAYRAAGAALAEARTADRVSQVEAGTRQPGVSVVATSENGAAPEGGEE